MGGKIDSECQAMLSDVLVTVRLTDLKSLLKRAKGKKAKKLFQALPVVQSSVVESIQATEFTHTCRKCLRIFTTDEPFTKFCDSICEAEWNDRAQAVETALNRPISEDNQTAAIQGMVAAFQKDPRLSISVRHCLKYIQLKADGADEQSIRRALGGIDASEFAAVKKTLDKYATAYALQADGALRKFMLDLLQEEMPRHGVSL